MGLLPFEDWYYHLSERRAEVMSLHREVMDHEQDISDQDIALRRAFADLREMTAYNVVLGLSVVALTGPPSVWNDVLKPSGLANAPTHALAKKGSDPILSELIPLLGTAAALKARDDMMAMEFIEKQVFGKFLNMMVIKPAVEVALGSFGIDVQLAALDAVMLEDVAITAAEIPTLFGIGAATAASIAATGIGIVVSIGLDAIFSAISGAAERNKLDAAINELKSAIAKLDAFSKKQADSAKTVAAGITAQRAKSAELIQALYARDHDNFDATIDAKTASSKVVLDFQSAAVRRFGQLYAIRLAVSTALARNPSMAGDAIANALMIGGPQGLGIRQINWYWDVLSRTALEMLATRLSAHPELYCSRIRANNSAGVTTGFRLGWVSIDGTAGQTPWSGSHMIGGFEKFDLKALSVPDGAQVWVEADPLAGSIVVASVTTRCDYNSQNEDSFSLKGAVLGAFIARD